MYKEYCRSVIDLRFLYLLIFNKSVPGSITKITLPFWTPILIFSHCLLALSFNLQMIKMKNLRYVKQQISKTGNLKERKGVESRREERGGEGKRENENIYRILNLKENYRHYSILFILKMKKLEWFEEEETRMKHIMS